MNATVIAPSVPRQLAPSLLGAASSTKPSASSASPSVSASSRRRTLSDPGSPGSTLPSEFAGSDGAAEAVPLAVSVRPLYVSRRSRRVPSNATARIGCVVKTHDSHSERGAAVSGQQFLTGERVCLHQITQSRGTPTGSNRGPRAKAHVPRPRRSRAPSGTGVGRNRESRVTPRFAPY